MSEGKTARGGALEDRLGRLERLVERLRGPEGCPWDREQTLVDVRAYLVEEAHEVAAAIDGGDWDDLATELGDLLFQIVFIARIASESERFDLTDVVTRAHSKMVERHPHVFGGPGLDDAESVRAAWEMRKVGSRGRSLLEDIPPSLPSLVKTLRMTQKVAAVGFDWPHVGGVLDKLDEELEELRAEIAVQKSPGSTTGQQQEIGDLLFTVANLARHLGVDPDAALATANDKFRRRFRELEERLAERGRTIGETLPRELEDLWEDIKRAD